MFEFDLNFVIVLAICMYQKDPTERKGLRWLQIVPQIKPMNINKYQKGVTTPAKVIRTQTVFELFRDLSDVYNM